MGGTSKQDAPGKPQEEASSKVPNTPTGTVTFLFTDIEGSTALHENYPHQMYAALERHDEILRGNIEANGGYVFSTSGDAFCAAFDTARDALKAALAAQRALFAEGWPKNVEVRVRMGLHTGVTEERDGNYFGSPVNRAARLMSAGHGGQVLLSDATYNLVRDHLAHLEPEAELRDLGEHRLKDLRYTEHVFQLVVPDLPEEFPALKTHGLVTPPELINLDRRYSRARHVGGGGMGEVYLAHHEALDRDMALKVLGRQYINDKQFVERFKREAKSAAKLNHPNIVQVYDAGEGLFEGQKVSYIAMEYVPGGTLKDLVLQQEGSLPPRMAVELTLQVAKALEAAHRGGVIHRDIKPQNILLSESGEAKVADFGIARAAASSTTLTQAGGILGTPHYISPEQVMGEPASFRSDLYSLGVVLYEMITAELPHDAETPVGIAMKHVNEPLHSPRDVNPEVPDRINAVCVRLLAKDPEERYPDAATLIDDLRRVSRSLEEDEAIVDQPPDGSRTEKDSAVAIPKGTEPPTVEIPNLAGKNVSQANSTLADKGLALGDQEEVLSDTVPEGEIVEQRPEAGMEAEPGSSVGVTVSSGAEEKAATIPDDAGRSIEEAGRVPPGAGPVLAGSPTDKGRKRTGTVASTDPSAVPEVASGTPVPPLVSSGRRVYSWIIWGGLLVVVPALIVFIVWNPWSDTLPVPDLVGLTENTAERRVGDDFQIEVSDRETSSEPEDTILSQSPELGELAQRGSIISVIVSAGQGENTSKEKTTFVINSGGERVEVEAEVFDDPAEEPDTWTDWTTLAEDAGVFYVYDQEQPLSYWTKDVPIPLSVAYIDSRGRIVDIQDMQPLDETLHPFAEPAQYALEVNQGFFEERGIEVGDRVELPPDVR